MIIEMYLMKLMNVDCQTTYQNIIKNVNDIFRIDDIFRMKIYLDVYVLLHFDNLLLFYTFRFWNVYKNGSQRA